MQSIPFAGYSTSNPFVTAQQAQQDFEMRKALAAQQLQTGGIDAQTKMNAYKTQILAGAVAGGQPAYDQARQTLQAQGIDTSEFAPDVQTASTQVNAARLAQAPAMQLLGVAQKDQANQLALSGLTGNITPGAKAPMIPGLNPMMPALVQQESGGNTNAVSPAGAQGAYQIMPATAAQPGYGVQPLQGMTNGNPATAPQAEQQRFSNDYLNAMQAKNGGNPQLAAASYNAGPGRVDAALKQLPAETQNYVQNVAPTLTAPIAIPKFNPPPQRSDETMAAYNARVQQAFESYKSDPQVLAGIAAASAIGGEAAKQTGAAATTSAMYDKLYQNLEAMKQLVPDMPELGAAGTAGMKATASQIFGDVPLIGDQKKAANAMYQWNQINDAQILNTLQQLVSQSGAGSSIRSNKTIVNLLKEGSGIPADAPKTTKLSMINNLEAELKNTEQTSQNVANTLTGQPQVPYSQIPVQAGQSSGGVVSYKDYFK